MAFLQRVMKMVLAAMVLAMGMVTAESLPQLSEKPWVGWFAGSENRGFEFGVQGDGKATLIPEGKKDERTSRQYWINIEPVIEEVLPNGRVVSKKCLDDGWSAVTKATDEAEKITYQGTSTGGARFEVTFEIGKGEILGGGKILEKGELTKNPIRLSLRLKVPNVYRYEKDEKRLKKTAGRDKIQLERVDGKKLKFDAFEPVWAEKDDVSGPGIKVARVDLDGFKGPRMDLDAGDKGAFEIWNGKKQALYKGFTFGWKPDPAKDTDGKARFVLRFK